MTLDELLIAAVAKCDFKDKVTCVCAERCTQKIKRHLYVCCFTYMQMYVIDIRT